MPENNRRGPRMAGNSLLGPYRESRRFADYVPHAFAFDGDDDAALEAMIAASKRIIDRPNGGDLPFDKEGFHVDRIIAARVELRRRRGSVDREQEIEPWTNR